RLVDLAFHLAVDGVTAKQQLVHACQFPGLYRFDGLVLFVEQDHFGAGSDVKAGFHLAAIAQGNADTGVGADQAFLADGNADVAAAREGAHGGAATAQVGPFADHDTSRDPAFHHGSAFGTGIEVDEAFVHDRCSFTQIGSQANPRRIPDTHAAGYHVIGHFREFVY